MSQLKVFEFAKEIGVETLVLMDKIREWKLAVRSHMATLDDGMMAEIRTRLDEAHAPSAAKPAKKKAPPRKKPAEKKAEAAPGAAIARPKNARAASVKRAAAAAPPVPEQPEISEANRAAAARASVIRRKAGEAEARAAEEARLAELHRAEQQQRAAEMAAQAASTVSDSAHALNTEAPASQASAVGRTDDVAGVGAPTGAPALGATGAPGTEAPKRRNIVGRMDLRRVATIVPNRDGVAAGSPRISRTAPRNIRTGFYSAEPTVLPADQRPEDLFAQREREDKNKPRRPGQPKPEEAPVTFTATEFRKREVIFQPKKKRGAVSHRDGKKTQITTPAAHKRVVKVDGKISLANLAMQMGVRAPQLLKKLMQEGVQASMNAELDFDTVALIAPEFGWEAQNTLKSASELISDTAFGELDAELVTRPPVVTVMGHVDHGKTSLLDTIRKARVAHGEAGGITQHIGAYSVTLDDGHKITFIDTPGHEAFTAMRARGANATDIAIIVVAADDGMMPQTQEAVNHAKAAGVPIIVAINKMDKAGANPDRIKQQLTELELVPEEWGGNTIYVPVSALKGEGIKELLEQIALVAEVAELKANPKRSGTGIVIESRVEKGRGSVATILVKDGTVLVGQTIVAGNVVGRVRSLMDENGKVVKEAGPGMPVEVLGLPEPPMAGDRFDVAKDEESARALADSRQTLSTKPDQPHSKMSLEQLFSRVRTGDTKELALILKSDVAGSLEALKAQLDKLGNDEVKIKLVHSGVGGINESDVLLGQTAKGVVVGFNVKPDATATRLAKEKGVEIKSYSIIYELIDDLKKALGGLLAPTVVEKAQGRAEVRNIFSVPKLGVIGGCFVTDGKLTRNGLLRLIRDGKTVYEGKVSSLKRFKDDAKEVASGFECGVGIENYSDLKVGDVIESFTKEEQVRQL